MSLFLVIKEQFPPEEKSHSQLTSFLFGCDYKVNPAAAESVKVFFPTCSTKQHLMEQQAVPVFVVNIFHSAIIWSLK